MINVNLLSIHINFYFRQDFILAVTAINRQEYQFSNILKKCLKNSPKYQKKLYLYIFKIIIILYGGYNLFIIIYDRNVFFSFLNYNNYLYHHSSLAYGFCDHMTNVMPTNF